jgi:hypothetical protein
MAKIAAHRKEAKPAPPTRRNDDDVWPEVPRITGRSEIGRRKIRAAVRAVLARKGLLRGGR